MLQRLSSNDKFMEAFKRAHECDFKVGQLVVKNGEARSFLNDVLSHVTGKSQLCPSLVIQAMELEGSVDSTRNSLPSKCVTRQKKNDSTSAFFLAQAQKMMADCNLLGAMTNTNLSLLFAKEPQQIAQAYLNRAKIFYELKFFDYAHFDLVNALNIKFEGEPREQALHLIINVCIQAQNKTKALEILRFYRDHLDEEQFNCFENRINQITSGKDDLVDVLELVNSYNWFESVKSKFGCFQREDGLELNTKFVVPENDPKQSIVVDKGQCVAPGQIVLADVPYAFVLSSRFAQRYCNNCLRELADFSLRYPCLSCTAVWYCSLACQQFATISYHRFECNQMSLLAQNDHTHLAFRIMAATSLDVVYKTFFLIYPEEMKRCFNGFCDPLLEEWQRTANSVLCTYFYTIIKLDVEENNFRLERVLHFAFDAYTVCKILTSNQYLELSMNKDGTLPLEEIQQWQRFLTTVIFKLFRIVTVHKKDVRHMQEDRCSTFQGDSNRCQSERISVPPIFNAQDTIIGSALYPGFLPFVDHSCEPNAELVFGLGGVCLVRTIKPLSENEPISIGFIDELEFVESGLVHKRSELKDR